MAIEDSWRRAALVGATAAADRLMLAGATLAVGLVVAQSVLGHDVVAGGELGGDAAGFEWVGVAAVAGAGLLTARLALETGRLAFWAAAAALTLFALDDALDLHQRLSAWRVADAALFAIVLVTLFLHARRLPAVAAWGLRAGLCLLVISGLLRVLFDPPLVAPPAFTGSSTADSVGTLAKEGAELAGWILVATALAVTQLRRAAEPPTRASDPETAAARSGSGARAGLSDRRVGGPLFRR